jgi:disulfide oxidoreductase YuzD
MINTMHDVYDWDRNETSRKYLEARFEQRIENVVVDEGAEEREEDLEII